MKNVLLKLSVFHYEFGEYHTQTDVLYKSGTLTT